jgi:hypothetical protein
MADSNWTDAPKADIDGWRKNTDKGQPPAEGYRRSDDSTNTSPPDDQGYTTKTHITIYTNVTCVPPPVKIYETCDKCSGHQHHVRKSAANDEVNIPATAQQHCSTEHFGDHYGQVFSNSTCKDSEIRREETTMITPGGQPMPSYDQWDQRSINHVTDGVFWYGAITDFPCYSGLGELALTTLREVEKIVAQSVVEAGLVNDPAQLQIALMDFLPLLRPATCLRQPQVSIERTGEALTMVLLDAVEPIRIQGRVAMHISADGRYLSATG